MNFYFQLMKGKRCSKMIHGHPGDEFQNLYKNTRGTILSRVGGMGVLLTVHR